MLWFPLLAASFMRSSSKGYTRKQWGIDPSGLDRSVTSRVPTRTNVDDRYFNDSFQAMPRLGFTHMFENMLDHKNITIETETEFADVKDRVLYDQLVFTGPVDEFFGHRYGKLPYRSLQFKHETHNMEEFQSVAVVNYPHPDVPYTRISEYKHLTGQKHPKTSITYEYPSAEGDPYYPDPQCRGAGALQEVRSPDERPALMWPLSAGWRLIATTTWTKWWVRLWLPTARCWKSLLRYPRRDVGEAARA